MKRYAVFSYEQYYPGGGWNDFKCAYDSLEEANSDREMSQVVDLTTGEIVAGNGAK